MVRPFFFPLDVCARAAQCFDSAAEQPRRRAHNVPNSIGEDLELAAFDR